MTIDFISDINKGYEEAMNYSVADKFIVKVLWYGFAFLCILTFFNSVIKISEYYPSPFSWRVIYPAEAVGTILLGFLSSAIPALLRKRIQNHYRWRILVTFTLTMHAYLFVFVSGGSIEMHFIFFCMVALAVIYSDWRLGWIMLVLVGLHHGILNYLAPTWVYFYGRNDFSLVAHALPITVAALFTTILCENNKKSIADLQNAKTTLEQLKNGLEQTVGERTKQLEQNMQELQILNKHMVGRELRMVELKEDITKLKQRLGA